MPALAELLARRAGIPFEAIQETAELVERELLERTTILDKRINIPCPTNGTTCPPGLVEANTVDPWSKSGKYALGWVYFCIILLVLTTALRWYQYWNDKIRVAIHKEAVEEVIKTASPGSEDYELSALDTDKSTRKFFPRDGPLVPERTQEQDRTQTVERSGFGDRTLNVIRAAWRRVFYRPIPALVIKKDWRPIVFPSINVICVVFAALAFVMLYCFIPQPLYWTSIAFGSPPLAIRAGMIAVAMMPWIVAFSMKANFISMMTGIGHERLNVLHRWLAYLCLLLSLIHMIPFYVTPVWTDGALAVFGPQLKKPHLYIYGTGLACIVPLVFLCVHSLPLVRRRFYEAFVMAHIPVSIMLLGFLFWHCKNFLSSWSYLWATTAIWLASNAVRLFYLNWSNPWRMSWLIGEEAAVTLLPESALKITVPTQMRWRPGQYVYVRMPGVEMFGNHPFTIASLCSDDFPSAYGPEYRDMVLVFRPFGGFTNRVLETALEHGPWHTYRTFLDGPYGGMSRSVDSFDHVVMVAGGSGITALVSQLLNLIKRMRDGKAVTKTVQLIWSMKRPETMEWFKEELRICREFAPLDTVTCQFYITSAKRMSKGGTLVSAGTPTRPVSMVIHEKVNDIFQNIASNRYSMGSSHYRNSALIRDEAEGDPEREKALRQENEDRIRPLPEAHLKAIPASNRHLSPSPERRAASQETGRSRSPDNRVIEDTPHMPPHPTLHEKRRSRPMSLDISTAQSMHADALQQLSQMEDPQSHQDFGFPSTPTEFQKNLMRFAFLPAAVKSKKTGWSTEWGRPDIPYMLRDMSAGWTGKRTCVFVCGPPSMRVDVSNTVAELQKLVWQKKECEEIFLHTENYAL
ncbi:ferric/cupric reductase transmembrane component 7-like [Teratosphaeria destructans]|uniref:ferric-chelate reductase (NADPH) n=1 Tax=Teratosphaeria destructans TaxID=418781 RepID=A0A9W7W548_9PEZI|nr:ferric/cupric reductase transmembrane component 7-like [Teratosphaeria destructans]